MTQADPIGAKTRLRPLTTDELLIRVGTGTTHNTLSSSEDVLEAVVFRDGNRGGFTNSGNETIFLIANNSERRPWITRTRSRTRTVSLAAFDRTPHSSATTLTVPFGVLAAATGFQDLDCGHRPACSTP